MPPTEPELTDVTLAVLAGGEGTRMGFAKGELNIDGRPILSHLLERFAWPGWTLLVTAPGREHPSGWEGFTREVSDPEAGQGPLRGVLTALEQARMPGSPSKTTGFPTFTPFSATENSRSPAFAGG